MAIVLFGKSVCHKVAPHVGVVTCTVEQRVISQRLRGAPDALVVSKGMGAAERGEERDGG